MQDLSCIEHCGFLLRQRIGLPAMGLLCAAVAGCTSLRTSREPVGGPSYQGDNKGRVGIYYFLPKALLTIQCIKASDGTFTITVTRAMVADQRYRYFLRWTQNPFYDDKVSGDHGITTNTEGLLTDVDISATDQSLPALNDLAGTAVNIFKILGEGAQAGDFARRANKQTLVPFKYTFDPLDRAEADAVFKALDKFGIVVTAAALTNKTQSAIGEQLSTADAKAAMFAPASTDLDHPRSGGVFFHPPTVVELRFDFRPAGAEVIHRESVMVPDLEHVACFRFGRSPFVGRDTTLGLTDGMPTSFKISRNSVIKGLTSNLKTITGTIADAIPTIVNVRVNRESNELKSESAVTEARTKLLDDRQKLLEAQKKLQETGGGGAQNGTYSDPRRKTPSFNSNPGGDLQQGPQSGDLDPNKGKDGSKKIHFEGSMDLPAADTPGEGR